MKAVTLFPKHVYAWSNLGTVLRELGELQGSVEAHKQVEKSILKKGVVLCLFRQGLSVCVRHTAHKY
jgi:hypothetical protein